MNITLEQLKEIANAGYGGIDKGYNPTDCKVANVCNYPNLGLCELVLKDYVDSSPKSIMTIHYNLLRFRHDYHYIPLIIKAKTQFIKESSCVYPDNRFCSLAAIRKMEELGLIEK